MLFPTTADFSIITRLISLWLLLEFCRFHHPKCLSSSPSNNNGNADKGCGDDNCCKTSGGGGGGGAGAEEADDCCDERGEQENGDFYDLVVNQRNFYVDKTMLIPEILQSTDNGKVVQITQPRGYGKTVNADMLKRFLDVEVNESGEQIPTEESVNRKLFVGGMISMPNGTMKRLDPLAVSQDFYPMQYQGKFPVVYLNLADVRVFSTYDEFERRMADKLLSVVETRYAYLKRHDTDRAIYENLFNFTGEFRRAHLERGLEHLCDLLSVHFNRKVFVIVDNYDAPIVTAYLRFGVSDAFVSILNLLSGIFRNCLKANNRIVEGGLITGVVPVFRYSLKANPVYECGLMHENMTAHYAFNRSEIERLIERSESPVDADDWRRMRNWCFGFRMGDSEYYSPALVSKYLNRTRVVATKKPVAGSGSSFHRIATGLLEAEKCFIRKALLADEMQDDLHNAMTGKRVMFSFTKSLDFEFFAKHSVLLNVVSHSGYLIPSPDEYNLYQGRFRSCYAAVPNKVAEYVLKTAILCWTCRKMNVSVGQFHDSLVTLLPAGRLDEYGRNLERALGESPNLTVSEKTRAREFFRGYALSLEHVLTCSDDYVLPNSSYSGHEKSTMTLIPRIPTMKNTILYGYRVAETASDLNAVAEQGLSEIHQPQQPAFDEKILRSAVVSSGKLVKICSAFFKRNVSTRYRVDDWKDVLASSPLPLTV